MASVHEVDGDDPLVLDYLRQDPLNCSVLLYHLSVPWVSTVLRCGDPVTGVAIYFPDPPPGDRFPRLLGWCDTEEAAHALIEHMNLNMDVAVFGSNTVFYETASRWWSFPDEVLPAFTLVHRSEVQGPPRARIGRLQSLDARLVNEHWHLGGGRATEILAEKIRDYPSGRIDHCGRPVAWSGLHYLTEEVGNLGFLFVLPDHRGQGYARDLTRHLIGEVRRLGRTPLIHIEGHNEVSVRLAESEGFEQIGIAYWARGTIRTGV